MAKNVTLVAVAVCTPYGSCPRSAIVKGLEWVVADHKKRRTPAVAKFVCPFLFNSLEVRMLTRNFRSIRPSLSLGGPANSVTRDAVKHAIAAGVHIAVAAGNSDQDACDFSPANEPTALTVAATEVDRKGGIDEDGRSAFSNYGPCVDVFAPGSLITSAWNTGDDEIKTISGTSMASPHVAGALAIYLSANPHATPAESHEYITKVATMGKIDLKCESYEETCPETPNRLLYVGDCRK
jgi:serine protease